MRKLLRLFDITLLPRSVWQHRSLLRQLITRNIAQKYKGAVLGFFWNFIQPLLMLCVYSFVFCFVFKVREWGDTGINTPGAYPVIMFCGIAAYNLFSEGVNTSCGLVVNNPNYVKKVIFPLDILIVGQVLSGFATGILWFLLVLAGAVAVFHEIHWTVLLLPVVLLPLFFITLGVGFFVSSLQVFLKDTRYVVTVLLQMLFYMTPIFYSLDRIPERYHQFLRLNPLTSIVTELRNIFLFGKLPDWADLGVAYLLSLIILQLGYFWFKRTKGGFADVL